MFILTHKFFKVKKLVFLRKIKYNNIKREEKYQQEKESTRGKNIFFASLWTNNILQKISKGKKYRKKWKDRKYKEK